jgi:RNA polymerase sigma-70 factor, ECF subfamily
LLSFHSFFYGWSDQSCWSDQPRWSDQPNWSDQPCWSDQPRWSDQHFSSDQYWTLYCGYFIFFFYFRLFQPTIGLTIPSSDIANQLKEGNESLFEELFREYYARLCGYALKYVWEKDQAEEIVQDLFFNLWNKRATLVITISVEAYLFRSVRNSCFNYLKHMNVRDQHADYIKETTQHFSGSVQESMELMELQEQIDKAIEEMPPERKKIFMMSRSEGLKYKDIAEKLDISIKTVEAQMGKALEFLREKLAEYLVAVTVLAVVIQIILLFINHE